MANKKALNKNNKLLEPEVPLNSLRGLEEENLKDIVENLHEVIMVTAPDGVVSYLSPGCVKLFGYSSKELVGTVPNIVYPEDNEWVQQKLKEALKGEKMGGIRYRIVTKKGVVKWIGHTWNVVFAGGKAESIISALNDITAQKNAEEEALREHQFSDLVIDSLPGIFYLFDKNGRFLRWNKNFQKVIEYSREEILKINPVDLFEGDDKKIIAQRIKEVFVKGNSSAEAYIISKSGKRAPYFFTGFLLKKDGKEYLVGAGIDMTDRIMAETKLRVSEEKFRSLFETSNDGITISDINGKLVDANKTFLNMLGYPMEELQKKSYLDIVPKKWHGIEEKSIKQMREKGYSDEYEKEYIKKDGSLMSVSIKIWKTKKQGEHPLVWSFIKDITEKKKVEKKIKKLNEKLTTWIESSPACTKMVDLDLNLQYMSQAGAKGLGVDVKKLYGKPYPLDFYPESFRKTMTANLKKVIRTGETVSQEAPVVDMKGKEAWFHSTIVPVKDDKGKLDYLLVVSIDTTKRKLAERILKKKTEQLEQFLKMTQGREQKIIELKKQLGAKK